MWEDRQVRWRNRRGEKHGRPWCTHPKEKEGGKSGKVYKSDKDTTVPSEKERTYGIDCLNLGDLSVDSESDSGWLLTHRREFQMENM